MCASRVDLISGLIHIQSFHSETDFNSEGPLITSVFGAGYAKGCFSGCYDTDLNDRRLGEHHTCGLSDPFHSPYFCFGLRIGLSSLALSYPL